MDGMTFVAGFIMGGFTTFIVTAVTVWKPRLDELTARWKAERKRRIEAEDNARHDAPNVPTRADWPDPLPVVERAQLEGYGVLPPSGVIDLTDIDDVPYDDA